MMKYLITFFLFALVFSYACTKDAGSIPKTPPLTDSALFVMVKAASDKYTWKSMLSSPDSVFTSDVNHGSSPYKLLMNLKAINACMDGGKMTHNGMFPDSSLLVKQLYNAAQMQVDRYAVMYKKDGAWEWAEYGATGTVVHSINTSSALCTSCHVGDRDRVWTFDAH